MKNRDVLLVFLFVVFTTGIVLLAQTDGCRESMIRNRCADALNPHECACMLGDRDACWD